MAAPFFAHEQENAFCDEPLEVSRRCLPGRLGESLVFGVGDASVPFEMGDGQHLPFIESEPGQHLIGEPVAPEGDNEVRAVLPELGLGNPGGAAGIDHVGGA